MTGRRHRSPRLSRRSGRWTLVTGILLLAAVGCLAIAVLGRHHPAEPTAVPLPPPPAASQPRTAARPVIPTAPRPGPRPLVARSAPLELRIPAIDVKVPVSTLALNPDDTVDAEPVWPLADSPFPPSSIATLQQHTCSQPSALYITVPTSPRPTIPPHSIRRHPRTHHRLRTAIATPSLHPFLFLAVCEAACMRVK